MYPVGIWAPVPSERCEFDARKERNHNMGMRMQEMLKLRGFWGVSSPEY